MSKETQTRIWTRNGKFYFNFETLASNWKHDFTLWPPFSEEGNQHTVLAQKSRFLEQNHQKMLKKCCSISAAAAEIPLNFRGCRVNSKHHFTWFHRLQVPVYQEDQENFSWILSFYEKFQLCSSITFQRIKMKLYYSICKCHLVSCLSCEFFFPLKVSPWISCFWFWSSNSPGAESTWQLLSEGPTRNMREEFMRR